MSNAFPEAYDELMVLAHHGATDAELSQRLAEREAMGGEERFRADQMARTHQGPTLADHRERWAMLGDPVGYHAAPAASGPRDSGDDGTDTATAPPGDTGGVPADAVRVADVLDWVGFDRGRARVALEDEQARAKPRATLVDALRKIVGGDGD